jgi:hypothetical protein
MDETVAQHSQMKWTVYYEEESTMNPSVEKIRDDLNYLREVRYIQITQTSILFRRLS